jgi:succinate dehydrogenase/fumarate reductase cytochrome b subunit
MALKRNVGLRGLGYRGGGPMLSWTLHRIGGLSMVLFVGLHIFVVYFHSLNGLRIIILDVWPKLLEYQREATWLQWLIFIPLYSLTAVIMIMFKLKGG